MKEDTEEKLVVGGVLAWGLIVLALNIAIICAVIHFVRKFW